VKVAQAQYHRPVPLIGNLNRGGDDNGQNKSADSNRARPKIIGHSKPGISHRGTDAQNDNEYQYCERSVLFHFNFLRGLFLSVDTVSRSVFHE
jgi:hypothetical protein